MFRGLAKTLLLCSMLICSMLLPATAALGHFGAIIPSAEVVEQGVVRAVKLEASFIHPMQGDAMKMARPVRFGVLARGEKTDLAGLLSSSVRNGGDLWTAEYKLKRPGDHIFFLEPAPY